MNTINDRIAYLIKDLGITKTKFAETINLSQPFVSAVCSGSKMPSDRTISDICREFNVSLAWLEDGEGEMYVQRSENERMALMFTDVLAEADESTRKRGIAAALEMPPEFWDNILEYAKKSPEANNLLPVFFLFVKIYRKSQVCLTAPCIFCILVEGGIYADVCRNNVYNLRRASCSSHPLHILLSAAVHKR